MNRIIQRLGPHVADANARRLDEHPRQFLSGAAGVCLALLVAGQITACSSKIIDSSRSGANSGAGGGDGGGGSGTGGGNGSSGAGGQSNGTGGAPADAGGHCVPEQPAFDGSCTNGVAGGGDFILDVDTHWFSQDDVANWTAYAQAFGPLFAISSEDAYVNQIFCSSETAVASLAPWPGIACTATRKVGCGYPLSNERAAQSRDKINGLAGSQRVLNHAIVLPQDPEGVAAELARMEKIRCEQGVAAWELYPGFKPGFRFGDPAGLGESVVAEGIALGVNRFFIHKGLPIGNFFDIEMNYPDDIGPLALKYPAVKLIVRHAAMCSGLETCGASVEGPYDATSPKPTGTDALIRTLLDNGIEPGSNVYTDTGSAFQAVMSSPDQAAHLFGKLLKYLGPDNVLWGTGAVIHGNPQSQIEAFRSLTIPQSMQDTYGYPELTAEIKAKLFGLNAARLYGLDPGAKRCALSSCVTTAP